MWPICKGVYFTWNVAEKRDTVSLEVVHRGSRPWLDPVGFPWAKRGPVKAAGASLQYTPWREPHSEGRGCLPLQGVQPCLECG